MRIREIYIHNFRSFRGPNRISFVNPVTDQVHPVSVIAGPNGSGKSTILEAIGALLEFAITELASVEHVPEYESMLVDPFISELLTTGLICISLELASQDYSGTPLFQYQELGIAPVELPPVMHIAVGRRDLLPPNFRSDWPNLAYKFNGNPLDDFQDLKQSWHATTLSVSVFNQINKNPDLLLTGGFTFLPHDRRLVETKRGVIEPPSEVKTWISRFKNSESWAGSLQQFWVWQNYLDLEKGKNNHSQPS